MKMTVSILHLKMQAGKKNINPPRCVSVKGMAKSGKGNKVKEMFASDFFTSNLFQKTKINCS